ncbi:MAG: response regulator [Opitutaceae bacterium]|nr:response regulator [Opitutaceae bacterium]
MPPQTSQPIRRIAGRIWCLIAYSLWACGLMGTTVCVAIAGEGLPSEVDPALPVLRSMGDVYAVPPAHQSEPHRIDMEVHLAYFDPDWNMAYVLSGDAPPQYLDIGKPAPPLHTGDVVRLTGIVRPNTKFALSSLTATRVVSDRPFKAVVVEDNLAQLLRLEIALVRLEAFVDKQFSEDDTHVRLHLIAGGERMLGILRLEADAPVPDLAGHQVTVEGILLPNRQTTPEFTAQVFLGDTSVIESAGLAAEDPRFTELPLTQIASLGQYATQVPVGPSRRTPWVRVEGRLDAIDSDRELIVSDATGRIRVSTAPPHGVARGRRLEICGVPELTTRGWRLQRPILRPSQLAPEPEPTPEGALESTTATSPAPADLSGKDIPPEKLPLLTTIQDYWNVQPDRRHWLHRFDFELHVGYCDPGWDVMWAESGGQMNFFNIRRTDLDLATGQVIRVSGLVRPLPGAFAIIPSMSVETVTPYRDFQTIRVDGTLTDPSLEGRMVRLTGLVQEQSDEGPFHVALAMIVDGYAVTARYQTRETDRFVGYRGQIVSLDGILAGERSSDRNFRGSLWVGRLATITPETTLVGDSRFNIPPSLIGSLAELPSDKPVRLIGTIRRVVPERSVIIEDESGQITILTAQKMPGALNTQVEVWGYPARDGTQVLLTRPLFRELTNPERVRPALGNAVRLTYRRAEDLLNLDDAAAAEGRAAKLVGVVTWSSPHALRLFIRDASAGIEVIRPVGTLDGELAPPSPGAVVVVEGRTVDDGAARAVTAESIVLQSNQILDDPPLMTVEQAWSGSEDAQRIKLAGYVRSVSHEVVDGAPRWTRMQLVGAGGRTFTASLPHNPAADQYVGGIVRVTGVCEIEASPPNHKVESVTLLLNLLSDIEEIDKARTDPFERELQTIRELRSFNRLRKGVVLARIRGRVLAHLPDDGFIVQDASEVNQPGIYVFPGESGLPEAGQTVDLVGLVGHSQERFALREARYRVIDNTRTMVPMVLNSLQTDSNYDCRFVRTQATLLDFRSEESGLVLQMGADGITFPATLSSAQVTPRLLDQLVPGSRLELTGVYRVDATSGEHANPLSLLLRAADDVRVIDRPSWFTAERARMLATALAVVVSLAFAWVVSLRRRVQHQTGQIRRQLVKEARLEDRQRNIIEKASDFIFMLDLSGNFTLFNPAGETMTGYSREDAPRLSIYDLIDESDRIGLRTSLLKARPGSEIQPFQTQFRRKDGTLIWVEVAMRFLVEDDRVTGTLCVARDITERKRVEEELKRARDAAEANTQAKSAFLANMSHEIRTPMNGVIGMSNLLLDTTLTHEQRDFALTIRNSAEALLTVLNDILDFSKIEAGKLQFETLDFDLTETVDDTLDLLAARAASKHLELAALIPTTLPQKLRGDPGRLRQVLLNLLGNAIKFTEKGEVSVSVALERETRGGYLLRFEVRDTGIGISPEEQQRLFMPFSQADVSTTRKYGGTGLGLAICHQIVGQMNGQIGVRSEIGQGSTFWFTVEFARGTPAPLDPGPETLRGQRVLGVDDNQINRTVLQHYLDASGSRLDLAASGDEALGMLRAAATAGDPFRLVLLDYHMPGMDGITLARTIHADPRLRGVAMALLTSVDRRFTAGELAAIGINASMAKPIRQRELMQTIQRALQAESAAPATTAPGAPGDAAPALPTLRVLIAEDNPVNQRLTRIQLKKLGFEADLACNGLEVLEAFERVNYDVIFMDCQMPELDGYDTARRLAAHPRRPEVRIVAMTANAMQGDRDKCLESGMDDYLSKPTRPDDLAAALRRAADSITRPV